MSLLPEMRRISSEYGFRQRKFLSQSFMVDERVLSREVAHAAVSGKAVLEAGPGFGFLTRKLAEAGAKTVVAVEKDARLIPILKSELAACGNVEIIHADFLKWNPEKFDVFVSNVPYSISSPLLFKLAEMKFDRAILCLQREFVARMLAKPGAKGYSRLSVTSQACFTMGLLEKVPRSAFHPIPKVDSSIIELIPTGGKLPPKEAKLILLLFQHKKKTLRAALLDSAEGLGISKSEASALAEKSGLGSRRVFTLERDELISLC